VSEPRGPQCAVPDSAAVAPIDAVVFWVDGSDPAHRAKLEAHLAVLGHRPVSAAPTRFGSAGEIDFCVVSLLRFAPFLRRIHIVTDAQRPPVLDAATSWAPAWRERLVLVDHRDIFVGHERHLPTFGNRSIETLMHRIPGLAEHFVHFNDDFMLIKPVAPEAFFVDGKPVLRGRFRPMPQKRWTRRLREWIRRLRPPALGRTRAGTLDAQALAARTAGFTDRFFAIGHNPYPMRRSTMERFFVAHPELLERNISYRLRDPAQFTPTSLANHLELRSGNAVVVPDDRCVYVKPASRRNALARLQQAESNPAKIFACIQSLEQADEAVQREVIAWLERVVGRAPPVPETARA
jgi:hypothetical protein